MLGCKPASTPMEQGKKLQSKGEPVDKGRYQRLVGKLLYLAHTRPDIGFAVGMVSRFMNSPTVQHMEAVYQILRYLKQSPGSGLLFKKTSCKEVEVFTDADWGGSSVDCRYTIGYCTFVWGNLVTWRSKKQQVVARSSAEAEFRAMCQGLCEGIWLGRMLKELKFLGHIQMSLYCDNKAAIEIAKNPVHHDRTKHVELDRHFIKEKIDAKIFKLSYVPTDFQKADILTKALPKNKFERLKNKLDMIDIHTQLEGE
ncbi:hypothetical protein L2E82_42771 [Cichorium intybus]|uniref:Uncharacterized protein n=1 Tax=Cichorium intybus TaxID=13427 RepID=A0ACB8ZML6_CICIN|nr:hypothetical protein L2E82_42771 [Cichorium intybus]